MKQTKLFETGKQKQQLSLLPAMLAFLMLIGVGSAYGQTTKLVTSSNTSYKPSSKPYILVTKVEAWGGGGGGGRCDQNYTVAGGGGGGGYAYKGSLSYTQTTSFNVNIGAGGSGETDGDGGKNSWIKVNGTTICEAGGGGGVGNRSHTGGSGGVKITGDGGHSGGRGGNAWSGGTLNMRNYAAGGGGGAAGPDRDGEQGQDASEGHGGDPGTGYTGISGHAGTGGNGYSDAKAGEDGHTYGGGGGGAKRYLNTSYNGGNGKQGVVRFTYYALDPGAIVHGTGSVNQGTGWPYTLGSQDDASHEGCGGVRYQWYCNGTALSGATSSTFFPNIETYPFLAEPGTYTFTRKVRGVNGITTWYESDNTFVLTVNCNPAIATDDHFTRGATSYTTLDLNILDNDVNAQWADFAVLSNPSHGTLGTLNGSKISYTPTSGYTGDDSFTYTLTNCGSTSTGTVHIYATRVELGCSQATSTNCFAFTNATFEGFASSLQISFSEDPDNCNITLPALPTGWDADPSVDQTGNNVAWFISLPDNVTAAQIQNFIRGITFCIPAGAIKDVTIVADGSNTMARVYYYGGSEHYYQLVKFTEDDKNLTWYDCYTRARNMRYLGRQGYLATLTSEGEDKFVTRLTQGVAWIGACRVRPTGQSGQYYNGWHTEDEANPITADNWRNGNYWYWACGPEIGNMLLPMVKAPAEAQGNPNWYKTITNDAGQVVYSNWNDGTPEPNDSGHEGFLTILKNMGNGCARHTEQFSWNDRRYKANAANDAETEWPHDNGYQPEGYLVEFGDKIKGNEADDVFTFAVQGHGGVGTFNPGQISGNDAICDGGTISTITPTVEAKGNITPILYMWKINGSEISGANASTYRPEVTTPGTYTYTRFAKDGQCVTTWQQSTGSYVLTIYAPFTAGAISQGTTTYQRGTTFPTMNISNSTAASGGDNNITYQWYVNDTPISGANAATYTIPADPYSNVPGTYVFTRMAKDGTCSEEQSTGSYTLTVLNNLELSLDCPTASGNCYSFPNATFDGYATRITVSFSDDPTGCSISFPSYVDAAGSGFEKVRITDYSWKIVLPEGYTSAQIQQLIRDITFCIPAGSHNSVRIGADMAASESDIYYFSGNDHYYRYVPYTSADEGHETWVSSYENAKNSTLYGRKG
ncbi:MAG: hypothetical protein IJK85_02260, partial [Bacteroidales bacterium]|nr:hypothetical protein [Bacteroidales bacterium]